MIYNCTCIWLCSCSAILLLYRFHNLILTTFVSTEASAKYNEDERGVVASKAIQKKSREIVKTIGDKLLEVALALFEEELISDSALEKAANHEIPTDSRAITLMLEIKEAVKEKPSCFHTVCDILGTDSLKGIYWEGYIIVVEFFRNTHPFR